MLSVTLQKAKGLMLRRNSPASKLSRALSNKSVSRPAPEDGTQGASQGCSSLGPPVSLGPPGAADVLTNGDVPKPIPKLRQFIMESPAQFTTVRLEVAALAFTHNALGL